MLSAKERLSRTEFTSFLSESGIKTVYNRLGTFKYKASLTLKVSVITSSKHVKEAVSRNKLRRRIYSLFRSHNSPFIGILYVSKQSYTFTYEEIVSLFADLVAKAHKSA